MGAIASPDDVLFADAREIDYAYVVFDDHYYAATSAIFAFLESHAIIRAAAMARGPTTRWRTASSPAARSPPPSQPRSENPSREPSRRQSEPQRFHRRPIYNEEGILRGSVLELREKLRPFGFSYELLLCENGSRDRTVEIGKELEAEYPVVRMLSVGQPNYGLAMKTGILEARGRIAICDEIDLCDTEFYARALALLERTDTEFVVGSKAMVGSTISGPWCAGWGRRSATAFCAPSATTAGPTRTGSRPSSATRCSKPPSAVCSTATSSPASSWSVHREKEEG